MKRAFFAVIATHRAIRIAVWIVLLVGPNTITPDRP